MDAWGGWLSNINSYANMNKIMGIYDYSANICGLKYYWLEPIGSYIAIYVSSVILMDTSTPANFDNITDQSL